MADVFVGPVIKKLIEFGSQYLIDQVIWWRTGMKEELERLQKNLPQIQAVVDYASTLEHIADKNPALNRWLWQLRDAIDEADDVMGELEYLDLKKQLTRTEKPRKVRSIVRSIKERHVNIVKRALKIDPTLKSLEKVVHKLDEISAGFATFLHLVDKAKQEHQEEQLELNRARDTGSLPKNVPIGRDNEKKFVMNWLRKTSNENQTTPYSNISLLSIVGQGGIGKTTLLQQIYNEEMKNESDEKEFDLKMWACVSNDFNKNTLIKAILESATGERSSLVTLEALQQTLKSTVNFNKFLLVLDDIWEGKEQQDEGMNKSKWEDVLAPLASGKLGSKILVSTRMESVAVMLSEIINKEEEKLILEGLNDEECLQLLYNHAFKKGADPAAYQNLWPTAQKIVKKLSGSPLAAKVIGDVLSSHLNESHWNKVSNYAIGNQNDILSILKLSYIYVPQFLQNCFSFCCTFPQDHEFDKDDLVRMWIALGFIQPDNTRGETMKDAGERYFDTLVQKSLFDKFGHEDGTFYLHDLLHEMLRAFSTQECLNIADDEEELLSRTPKTIRHLFVENFNSVVLRKVEEFKHLRSFILVYSGWHEDLVDILAKIFKTLRSIRLMCIKAHELKNIPKEIEDLIHLQYLTISFLTELPTPVSLPAFWQLPFLKYLSLENMPQVKGFDYKFRGNDKVRVFPSLQVLHVKRLLALEDWYVAKAAGYECLFPCLTELHLKFCPNLLELPAGLPPKLEKLVIDNIGWKGSNWLQGITNYCSIFIRYCPNLIYLVGYQEMETAEKCQLILSELAINDPSLLRKLPLTTVTSVQKLEIKDCGEMIPFSIDDAEEWFLKVSSSLCELKFTFVTSLLYLPSYLESLSSLKTLHVSFALLLPQLPNMPASLKVLELKFLESLQFLPSSLSLSSLEHIYLKSIPLIQKLPDLPPSLCELLLYNLSNLHCLPSCISHLFSLKELRLVNLPQLRELPDLPPSLKILVILNCHPELMERCKKVTGSDWHKIAHIPEVYMPNIGADHRSK